MLVEREQRTELERVESTGSSNVVDGRLPGHMRAADQRIELACGQALRRQRPRRTCSARATDQQRLRLRERIGHEQRLPLLVAVRARTGTTNSAVHGIVALVQPLEERVLRIGARGAP